MWALDFADLQGYSRKEIRDAAYKATQKAFCRKFSISKSPTSRKTDGLSTKNAHFLYPPMPGQRPSYTDIDVGQISSDPVCQGVWRYLKLKDVTQMRLTSFAFYYRTSTVV